MLLFSSMEATAKYLTQTYPVVQVVWARFTFHMVLMVIWLGRRLPRVMITQRPGLQLLRSILQLAMTISFFAGLRFVPLADASAILFVAPILATALCMPLLGERVGRRRWAAVVVGFAGALIIIRPGTEMMQFAALLPLTAACCSALYQITVRMLTRTDTALTTLLYTALFGAVTTSVVVPFYWTTPDLEGWILMAALASFGCFGHFAWIKAFEVTTVATVAPFNYTRLIWAVLLGYLLFGQLPDIWVVFGAVIITGSGLYILRQEQQRHASGQETVAVEGKTTSPN